ncbi:MAG: DUF2062 domain-containing protein [Acidobacteriota bacterium]
MMRTAQTWETAKAKAASWLLDGISPERLAVTLALGFVLGFIPVVGLPTALCAILAVALRLNLPAIQAANYAAMPFQIALLVPFVRMGGKLAPAAAKSPLDMSVLAHAPLQLLLHSSSGVALQFGRMAGQALLAWTLVAIPVAIVLTLVLTGILRRVPLLAKAAETI